MSRLVRRALMAANSVSLECKMLLDTAKVASLGFTAGDVIAGQGFEITTPAGPAGGPITYAVNSSLVYNVSASWDAPRISVSQFTTVSNANDSPFFSWLVNDTDRHELRYMLGTWTYYINGVAQPQTVSGAATDMVVYRQYPNGDFDADINGVTLVSASLGADPTIQLIHGMIWEDGVSTAAGLKARGYVYTNVTDPDLEISHAAEGDANWCGTELFVEVLEEPAASQTLVASGSTSLIERHALVDTTAETVEEPAANQTFTVAGDTTLIERHQAVAITEETLEDPAANQTFVASGDVTLIERHTTV